MSVTSNSAQITQFLDLLKGLDPEINPYDYIAAQLTEYSIPKTTSAFWGAMKATWAFAGVGLLAACIAIIAKGFSGGLWLIRRRPTSRGVIWAPNTSLLLILFSLMFFSFAIPLVYYTLELLEHKNMNSLQCILQAPLWLPIAWLIHSEYWGAAVSGQLQSSQPKQTSGRRAHRHSSHARSTRSPLMLPAIVVNLFFVLGYAIHFIVIVTLFTRMSLSDAHGRRAASKLMNVLQTAGNKWQTGQDFQLSLPFIQYYTEYVSVMSGEMLDRTAIAMRGFGFLLLGQLVIIFIPFAWRYHEVLGKQLHYLRSTSFDQKKIAPLRHSYIMLRIQSAGVCALACCYSALGLAMGLGGSSRFAEGGHIQQQLLCGLYFFSIIAAPLTCLLAWRSVRPLLKKNNESEASASQGVRVHTERAVAIDHGEEKDGDDSNRCPIEYWPIYVPANRAPPLAIVRLDSSLSALDSEAAMDDKGTSHDDKA